MNEKFFDLPQEKQERILNAALKCFAKSGYKHTVTDDIAAQAEISKGLLFHYFENKKGLYEYLFGYSMRFVEEQLKNMSALEGDDFFDIIRNATNGKIEMMKAHPHLFDFIINAYYDESAPAMGYIENLYATMLKENTERMMRQVDRGKFREGLNPEMLLNIVFWCADGMMLHIQRAGNVHDPEAARALSNAAMEELKRAFYK